MEQIPEQLRVFNPNAFYLMQYAGDATKRFLLMYGGSSSSKSYSAAQVLLLLALTEGDNALVVRKVSSSISKTIYEDFKVAAAQLGMKEMFRFTVNSIRCVNGAKIDFCGIDDPEKIKGISNYKRVLMEELCEFDEADFKQIRIRLRGREGQQIWATWNPISETHWIKKSLIDGEKWHEIGQRVELNGEEIPSDYCRVKSVKENAPKVMMNPQTGEMEAVYNTPEAGQAWFITMSIFALVGLMLLIVTFCESKERIVMDKSESAQVKVSDLWMELVRNRPLRVLSIFFVIAFTTMSISNAADSYFMTFNMGATPLMTTVFMWLGTIPAFIFMPMVPAIKYRIGKNGMFRMFLGIAIVAMILMYLMMSVESLKSYPLLFVVQFVKSTGVVVATGYMWALVPEVVTYSEFASGRRVAGIVNALICIFMKAGMALGGVIPGLVLAWVGFQAGEPTQTPMAEQGILWLVTLIPAALFVLAIYVIGKYELSDEKMDELNAAVSIKPKH